MANDGDGDRHETNIILVGFHVEDAIYAPRYYGRRREWEYGETQALVRNVWEEILDKAPATGLIR